MWSEIEIYGRLMAATEPGPGAALKDTNVPVTAHLKMKSIPNADTDRLLRVRLYLHDMLHTPEGLRHFDQPRRQLVNGGLRIRAISHELHLRGYCSCNGCRFCTEGKDGPDEGTD